MNETNICEAFSKTEKRPFFSIIIPVYNAEHFLKECLESILAQDFQDWEAILVDDKSSDDSMAMAQLFSKRDERIKVYASQRNSGGCHAPRMRAASMAKGEYVVPIDADDYVAHDYLSRLYACISSKGVDLALTEMWRLSCHDSHKVLPLPSIDIQKIYRGKDLVSKTLLKWCISMNGFAVRRNIYLDADRKLTAKDLEACFVDEFLSRWILFLSTNVGLCQAIYYYRDNSQSVTNINQLRLIDGMLKVSDSLIDMTSKTFGYLSPTHVCALEHKLYSSVGFLRLINSGAIPDHKGKQTALRTIARSMKGFDMKCLKGKTSPRYLALMHLPIRLACLALKIIDPIINRKNGV